jgi:hypothetical protein
MNRSLEIRRDAEALHLRISFRKASPPLDHELSQRFSVFELLRGAHGQSVPEGGSPFTSTTDHYAHDSAALLRTSIELAYASARTDQCASSSTSSWRRALPHEVRTLVLEELGALAEKSRSRAAQIHPIDLRDASL